MDGAFGPLLLDWYRREARALPWRATRDPYAILVSEIMLQQTQAARVVPHYHAFLGTFPTVTELAAAPLADVLTAWRGLGYNRRARNLHRTAVAITEDHGGVVPSDLKALRALPGLGDYTARAVLAFAFDEPVAPVDVNIGRVLARAVSGAPLTRASAQRLADELVPVETPGGSSMSRDPSLSGTWSHALMDLGARVCTARQPRCMACPVAAACIWRGDGPDPAATSAIRSRPQSAFSSSDRYHRGRLVDAMRAAPVREADLAGAAHLDDPTRLERVVAGVIADGLAEWCTGMLQLPGRREG